MFEEWAVDDRMLALAWMAGQARLCTGCGTDPAKWRAEGGGFVDPLPYEFKPVDCLGCQTKNEIVDSWPEKARKIRRLVVGKVRAAAPPLSGDDGVTV